MPALPSRENGRSNEKHNVFPAASGRHLRRLRQCGHSDSQSNEHCFNESSFNESSFNESSFNESSFPSSFKQSSLNIRRARHSACRGEPKLLDRLPQRHALAQRAWGQVWDCHQLLLRSARFSSRLSLAFFRKRRVELWLYRKQLRPSDHGR